MKREHAAWSLQQQMRQALSQFIVDAKLTGDDTLDFAIGLAVADGRPIVNVDIKINNQMMAVSKPETH